MAAYPNDIDLKEQYRLVELKKMLSQYGMRSFHVSYAARAKAIARYILTRDQPTVMEDALKVTKHTCTGVFFSVRYVLSSCCF